MVCNFSVLGFEWAEEQFWEISKEEKAIQSIKMKSSPWPTNQIYSGNNLIPTWASWGRHLHLNFISKGKCRCLWIMKKLLVTSLGSWSSSSGVNADSISDCKSSQNPVSSSPWRPTVLMVAVVISPVSAYDSWCCL